MLAAMMMMAAVSAAPAVHPVVNLNNATLVDLVRLPGVGRGKAQRIVEQRTRRPFRRPEDLMAVKGFGPKSLARLRPYLAVSGPTTLRIKVVDPTRKRGHRPPRKPAKPLQGENAPQEVLPTTPAA